MPEPILKFALRLPLVVLVLFLPAIGLAGYYYYVQQTRHIEQAILEQLGSIGDLKSQQISDWVLERKADAEVLTNSLAGIVGFLLHPGADRQSGEALDWLSAWLKHYHYRKIRLVDAAGTMQLSMPEHLESSPPALLDIAREAMRTHKVMISSFYRAPDEQIYLDIIAPIYQDNNAAGAVLISVDPHDFLFPIVRSWPTPSPSAETLLVQREGNEVVFLNELRHRRNAPLSLRLPLDKPNLPEAMAVRGKNGIAYGADYRDVPVLATLRSVAGTPWHIVAKIDREEIYAPVRESALRTAFIVAMLALLASVAVVLLWRRQRELALWQEKEYSDNLIQTANAMIVGLDAGGNVRTFNEAAEQVTGYGRAEMLGRNWFEVVVPQARYPEVWEAFSQWQAAGHLPRTFENPILTKSGEERHITWQNSELKQDGKVTGTISFGIDITERKQAELKLCKLSRAVEQSANTVVITDIKGIIEYVNPRFCEITGYAADEVIGKTPRILKSGEAPPQVYERLWKTLLAGDTWHGEFHNRKKNGDLYWCLETISPIKDEIGCISNFVSVTEDISDLKYAESTIKHLAYYDPLTNLPNRRLFRDRLEQAVIGARRDGDMLAVMHLNLDRFKLVNDTLGHETGDQLLKAVAERLANSLREGDTIARLSGDEFMVVAQHLAQGEDAVRVAEKIVEVLQQPFVMQAHEFFISTSIGICIFPTDTDDIDTLFKNADIALRQAKEVGHNNFRFFSADMNADTLSQLELEAGLRHALERNEFVLHYQPQVNIENGKTVGVEALIRWMHPEHGLVPPSEFIPLAEETGLILSLSEWVLKTACSQMREWQDAGLPAVRVAVNLSAKHFRQPDLVTTVARILHETRLAPQYLELEITEGTIMLNAEQTIAVLHELRAMGVELSVDDFGTGYSSLSYLKRFPVNTLKIDRSFVKDVTTNPEDAALARAIIAMAHSLNLRVIAEGVETEGQQVFFADHHCDEIQGYYFSRPLPADDCAKFLQQSPRTIAGDRKPEQRTLLLVDDEVNIATSLKRMLRSDGYHILTATSGMEGLELLASNRIGVIISDQRMPEMTGVEFLHRVKQLYPDTVRIVLSGYTDLKSVTDAINDGAVYKFLTKPWEDEQLREQVHEAFHRFELKQENIRLSREIERANSELSNVNRDLERRVAEKTQEIRHNINVLQVSQEVLEHLPTAVIGVDEDGLIVMANHQANALFDEDGSLLGCEAIDRLPAVVIDCMEGGSSGTHVVTLANGQSVRIICHRMGEMCRSKGTVMVISLVDNV